MLKLRLVVIGIILSALGYILLTSMISIIDRRANGRAQLIEQASLDEHERACAAEMERRMPEAEAEAAVRRGVYRPIALGIGDDVREIVAIGLSGCNDMPEQDREPAIIPSSEHCDAANRLNLAGPHPRILNFAMRYNRRLLALAPRQVARACGALPGTVRGA